MAEYDGHPVGIECRMKDRESWAFVLTDASGARPWRIQQFDMDGFVGHLCFDSLEEAVEDMLHMEYRVTDPGALDRVRPPPGGQWVYAVPPSCKSIRKG